MRIARLLTALSAAVILTNSHCLRAQVNFQGCTKAPFSARFKISTVQTLANGVTVTDTSTGMVARDSQGRTYREYTHESGQGEHAHSYTSINIMDPLTAEIIQISPGNKTATIHSLGPHAPGFANRTSPCVSAPGDRNEAPGTGKAASLPDEERLGTRVIEGVIVQGFRNEVTVPVGQEGNDAPLITTAERWFSPELVVDLQTKIDDPRRGVTKTELSDIQRSEPDPTLFQIPGDYTVKEVEEVKIAH